MFLFMNLFVVVAFTTAAVFLFLNCRLLFYYSALSGHSFVRALHFSQTVGQSSRQAGIAGHYPPSGSHLNGSTILGWSVCWLVARFIQSSVGLSAGCVVFCPFRNLINGNRSKFMWQLDDRSSKLPHTKSEKQKQKKRQKRVE